MIKYLQSKKGFSLIELIVVLAIIAVLIAIIFPMITNERARIREANNTARDFYAAVQSVFTKYSSYDGPLSPSYAANGELGILRHYQEMGGNYPFDNSTTPDDFPETTSVYLEIGVKNNKFLFVNVLSKALSVSGSNQAFYDLVTKDAANMSTELGRLLESELLGRINYLDGFYYAKITYTAPYVGLGSKMEASTVKVAYALYMKNELPLASGGFSTYQINNLVFGADNKLSNGEICGSCAPWNEVSQTYLGLAGTMIS
ncbi:MAG: prepilin-type N-terminal cleavage/methylation domain-containing protein [Oscillospiraceae bacterium]|nr:prepilin-type N-terminal cleavage/methylation domain-containing protein [Oscillospiraceae bacterium]